MSKTTRVTRPILIFAATLIAVLGAVAALGASKGEAAHNHGPGHRYAKIDDIAAAIKDHNPKIGCCIDTGHFLRSKEDPVRAAEVFGKRIYGVHLKDVKDATTFTVLGDGDLRTAALLKALAALKSRYCLALEYEENPSVPMADLRVSLAAVRKAVATLPGGVDSGRGEG